MQIPSGPVEGDDFAEVPIRSGSPAGEAENFEAVQAIAFTFRSHCLHLFGVEPEEGKQFAFARAILKAHPGIGHNQPPPDLAELVQALPAQLAEANKDLVDRVGELEESAKRMPDPITDEEQAKKVADFVAMIAAGEGRRKERFAKAKRVWLDGAGAVDTFFNAIKTRLATMDAAGRRRALVWDDAKEAAERERRRLEAERQRQEAERLRKEAEAKAAEGKMEQAVTRAEHAQAAEQRAQAQEAAPPPSATRVQGAVGSLGARRRWVHEVKDEKLVPREYLVVSDQLVKAGITALKVRDQLKDGEEYTQLIPGVRIFQEKTMGR